MNVLGKESGGRGSAAGRRERNRRVTAFALSFAMTFNLFPAQAIAEALPGEPEEPVAVEQQVDEVAAQQETVATEEVAVEDEAPEAEAEPAAEEPAAGEAAAEEVALVAQASPADETPLVEQREIIDDDISGAVATAQGRYFTTVQEAIDVTPAGGVVELLQQASINVTVDHDVTLDLGGKTNISVINAGSGVLTITNPGATQVSVTNRGNMVILDGTYVDGISNTETLTIVDATCPQITNTGTMTILEGTYVTTGSTATETVLNRGTLTILGGEFENQSSVSGTAAVVSNGAGTAYSDATLTIEGGSFKTTNVNNYGAVINNNGQATITGGEFANSASSNTSASAEPVLYNSGASAKLSVSGADTLVTVSATGAIANNLGTVEITGGSFELAQGKSISGAFVSTTPTRAAAATTTISGGTFDMGTGNGYLLGLDASYGAVEVTGGSFTYASLMSTASDVTDAIRAKVQVSGGLFNHPVPAANVAAGNASILSGDTTYPYTVGEAEGLVAGIVPNGETAGLMVYSTLQGAINAIAAGNVTAANDTTITLIGDADEDVTVPALTGGTALVIQTDHTSADTPKAIPHSITGNVTLEDGAKLTLGVVGSSTTNDTTTTWGNNPGEAVTVTAGNVVTLGEGAELTVVKGATVAADIETGRVDAASLVNNGSVTGAVTATSGTLTISSNASGTGTAKWGTFDQLPTYEGTAKIAIKSGLFLEPVTPDLCFKDASTWYVPRQADSDHRDGSYRYTVDSNVVATVETSTGTVRGYYGDTTTESVTTGGLQNAVAAVGSRQIVRLQKDVTLNAATTLDASVAAWTLDLNGHKISGTVNSTDALLTLKDTVTVIDSSETGYGMISNSGSGAAVALASSSSATFEGGRISSTNATPVALSVEAAASVVVPEGSLARFTGKLAVAAATNTTTNKRDFKGGYYDAVANAWLTKTGAAASDANAAVLLANGYWSTPVTIPMADEDDPDGKDFEGYRIATIVAMIGTEGYDSLQAAVNAATGATAAQTIKLVADIAEATEVTRTQEILLDLNGHKVTGAIADAGALTIVNSKNTPALKSDESNIAGVALSGAGTLTVDVVATSKASGQSNANYGDVVVAAVTSAGSSALVNYGTVNAVTANSGHLSINNAAAGAGMNQGKFASMPESDGGTIAIAGGFFTEPVTLDKLEDDYYTMDATSDQQTAAGVTASADVKAYKYTIGKDETGAPIVARIGDVYYKTLPAAVKAAEWGDTINLVKNVTLSGGDSDNAFPTGYTVTDSTLDWGLKLTKSLVIDGSATGSDVDDYVITVGQYGIAIAGESLSKKVDVTFKNVGVTTAFASTNDGSSAKNIEVAGYLGSLTLDNVSITNPNATGYAKPLELHSAQTATADVTIKGSAISADPGYDSGYAIRIFQPVNMNVSDSSVGAGWGVVYAKQGSRGSVIDVSDSTLYSKNATTSGDSNDFAAIVFEDDSVTVNVSNTVMELTASGKARSGAKEGGTTGYSQALAMFSTYTADSSRAATNGGVRNCVVNLGSGNEFAIEGDVAGFAIALQSSTGLATYQWPMDVDLLNGNTISISGGKFSKQIPQASYCAEGMMPSDFTHYIDGAYDAEGGFTVVSGTRVASITADDQTVQYFSTLQEALDTANAGEEVDLLVATSEDVTVRAGADVKLDLNGYDLTSEGTPISVEAGAALELLNSSDKAANAREDFAGKTAAVSTTSTTGAAIMNDGTLYVHDVIVEGGLRVIDNAGSVFVDDVTAGDPAATLSTSVTGGVVAYNASDEARFVVVDGTLSSVRGTVVGGEGGSFSAVTSYDGAEFDSALSGLGGAYSADFTAEGATPEAVTLDVEAGNVLSYTAGTKLWTLVVSLDRYSFDATVTFRGTQWTLADLIRYELLEVKDKITGATIDLSDPDSPLKTADLDTSVTFTAVPGQQHSPADTTSGKMSAYHVGDWTAYAKGASGSTTYSSCTNEPSTSAAGNVGTISLTIEPYDLGTTYASDWWLGDPKSQLTTTTGTVTATSYSPSQAATETGVAVNVDGSSNGVFKLDGSTTIQGGTAQLFYIKGFDANYKYASNAAVSTYTGVKVDADTYANNFAVTRANPTEDDYATVTVHGQGDFTGDATLQFAIVQLSLKDCSSPARKTVATEVAQRTGATPDYTVRITENGKTTTLVEGIDYTVSGTNTITGKGNYADAVPTSNVTTATEVPTNLKTSSKVTVYLSDVAPSFDRDVLDGNRLGLTSDIMDALEAVDATAVWGAGQQLGVHEAAYTGQAVRPALSVVVETGAETARVYTYDPTLSDTREPNATFLTQFAANTTGLVGPAENVPYVLSGKSASASSVASNLYFYGQPTSVLYNISAEKKSLADATVTLSPAEAAYDGTAKYPTVTVALDGTTVPASAYTVSYLDAAGAEASPVAAGAYTVVVTAVDGSGYAGTATQQPTFTVTPKQVAKPIATDATYDGTEKTGVAEGEGYTLSGTTKATEAGDYTATATLADKANTCWADGTTGDLTLTWSITEEAKPVDKTALQDEILDATFALLDAPQVSTDGSDVSPLDEWVTKADVSAMRKAITDARNAGKAATTQEEVDQALADLVAAEVAFFDATKDGRGTPTFTASKAHIQTYGDREFTADPKTGVLSMGTTGESKRVENMTIGIDATEWGITGGVTAGAHVQSYGDMAGTVNADGSVTVGTSGQSKRMEAFWLSLTGDLATYYDVYYRAHIQSKGWLGWAKNGERCGSEGGSKRMESLDVVVLPKGETPAGYDATQKAYLTKADFA